MLTISKTFAFSAAHHLPHLPVEHPCHNVHGHNYEVTLILQTRDQVDERGFVADYRDMDAFKEWINRNLDHRDLNEVLPSLGGRTTSEALAGYIFSMVAQLWGRTWAASLHAVRVAETPKTWAEYSRD